MAPDVPAFVEKAAALAQSLSDTHEALEQDREEEQTELQSTIDLLRSEHTQHGFTIDSLATIFDGRAHSQQAERLAELTALLAEIETAYAASQIETTDVKTESQLAIGQLRDENILQERTIRELREALADRENSAGSSEKALSDLRAALDAERERADAAERGLSRESSERQESSKDARSHREALRQAEESVRRAESARDLVTDSLATAIARAESAEADAARAKGDLAVIKAEASKVESERYKLRMELVAEEEKSSGLIAMLARCEREQDELLNTTIPALRNERDQEIERQAAMVEALSFYADSRNSDRWAEDDGRRARRALGIQEGKPIEA